MWDAIVLRIENTTTTNAVFQFAKIEYHSETFQRYFS